MKENISELVQDMASKGLALVYENTTEPNKKELVNGLLEQLLSGRRAVQQVTGETKLFEEGQLGAAPTGGNLSTYKELCSLASDLNQPDLIYKFMHLANHNAVWNSKKVRSEKFCWFTEQNRFVECNRQPTLLISTVLVHINHFLLNCELACVVTNTSSFSLYFFLN